MKIYNDGNHSPVRGSFKPRREALAGACKVTKVSPEEAERMLAERWPGKIEPIRHALPIKLQGK